MIQPTLSVVIPVFNGSKFLAEALHSVMCQGISPLEIIVVDDGSSDNSAGVAEAFAREQGAPVQVIRQENQGPSAARNKGLRQARGELLVFLDADDLLQENSLVEQVAVLEANPQIQYTWGGTQTFTLVDGQRSLIGPCRNLVNIGSLLFRRPVFDEIGEFDESLRFSEDMDIFKRLEDHRLLRFTRPEVVLWYRYHGENTWLGQPGTQDRVFGMLRRRLERRRAGEI